VFCCWLLVGQRFLVGVGSGRKRLNILGAYQYSATSIRQRVAEDVE
jgi:hypothetical protein